MQTTKLLIIEDQQEYRDAARQALNLIERISIEFAIDYDETVQKMKKEKYNGVLTDCFFPKKTGSGDKSAGVKAVLEMMAMTAEKCSIKQTEYQELAEQWREWDGPELPNLDNVLSDPLGHFKYFARLCNAIKNGPENQQPLGALIMIEAEKRGIPCIIVTSTFHHDDMTQPIHELWGDKLVDVYQEFQGPGFTGEIKKETPMYWNISCAELLRDMTARIGDKKTTESFNKILDVIEMSEIKVLDTVGPEGDETSAEYVRKKFGEVLKGIQEATEAAKAETPGKVGGPATNKFLMGTELKTNSGVPRKQRQKLG